jgi:hypothetical protein
MTNNNNLISPITTLLTDFLFMEQLYKEANSDQAIRMVEAVLHSADPIDIGIALENRYQSWTEGDQDAFKPVVAKCNELFGTPLSFSQKATIAEEWVREHGLSNLGCVSMEEMIEEVAMNGDADDILCEVMRHNERNFQQFITCKYDFDDIIGWFNETLIDYVISEYTLNDIARHCENHEIMDAAVRNVDLQPLLGMYRERGSDVGLDIVPDALENNMDHLIEELSTYLANPENFEKYGTKLVKELFNKNSDFMCEFIDLVNGEIKGQHTYLKNQLADIQDGINQELTVRLFKNAESYIQGLLDEGMWFSDACHILQFSDPDYNLTGNHENINKFWDLLADTCVAPEGVEPKTEQPLF